MSQENVEIVRAGYEAWNAGDMDAYGELLHPDVIWRPPEGWPEPGPFVGREAVLRELEQVGDTWEADAAEPISESIDAGDKVLMRFHWRLKGWGPDASTELTYLYTVRDGKHLSFEFFWDHAAALEAAGLRGSESAT